MKKDKIDYIIENINGLTTTKERMTKEEQNIKNTIQKRTKKWTTT